jgi:hypothetical protein
VRPGLLDQGSDTLVKSINQQSLQAVLALVFLEIAVCGSPQRIS